MIKSIRFTSNIATVARSLMTALTVMLFTVMTSQASPVDTFEFKDEATKLRFQILSRELRCPKCQNQNLSDSNSPIAADLRLNLYNLLQEGKSDTEIIDFMVYRYGDFVLYRPQLKSQTYVLWFGPLVLVLGFGMSIVYVLRRREKNKAQALDLSVDEQANLDDILKK